MEQVRTPRTRLGRSTEDLLRPFVFAALVVIASVQLATRELVSPALAVTLFAAVVLLTSAAFLPWTRIPVTGQIGLALAASVLSAILLPLAQSTIAPGFAFVASAVAGEKLASRRAAVLVAVAGAVTAAVAVWVVEHLHPMASGWPWWLGLAVAAPVYLGISRQDHRESVRNAERAYRSEAREVALLERGRIAREIHDVLGHSLSGISLQLDLADALHGKGRDGEANLAVRRARALAVGSIAETRHAIEALREDSLPLSRTLELMAMGDSVPLTVTGEQWPVPTEIAHAVIRAAQEALVNAAKHAPGADRSITLRYTPGAVGLIVANGPAAREPRPGPADGGGMGLVGMRERIALLGGTLKTGPGADGAGWIVELEIPK
ncbi:sensor histidine kinase [Amycolatopsis saalfeldensis]|uniref:histidine kinase n=1 Tax=Amycolatopsis saalfeldensis TaxID=394193 RepID=A0A1H8UWB7_9PSEU|nr:histidine kinase [Amycolatopsis saalfeldensis]SEP07510.1 Signal transduction histidine kinase [Amycolatopsis saalfeldensis]